MRHPSPPRQSTPERRSAFGQLDYGARSAASASRGCWGRVTGISPRPVGNSPASSIVIWARLALGAWGTAEETSGVEEDLKSWMGYPHTPTHTGQSLALTCYSHQHDREGSPQPRSLAERPSRSTLGMRTHAPRCHGATSRLRTVPCSVLTASGVGPSVAHAAIQNPGLQTTTRTLLRGPGLASPSTPSSPLLPLDQVGTPSTKSARPRRRRHTHPPPPLCIALLCPNSFAPSRALVQTSDQNIITTHPPTCRPRISVPLASNSSTVSVSSNRDSLPPLSLKELGRLLQPNPRDRGRR